jgi:hypothetical protein
MKRSTVKATLPAPARGHGAMRTLSPAELDRVSGGSEVSQPIMLVSGERESR